MYFIQAIILTVCVGYMLFSTKEVKLIVFIISFFCMDLFSYKLGPLSSAKNVLILTYCISEWSSIVKSFSLLKQYHIFWLVVIMIIPAIVLAVHSPHYSSLRGAMTIFLNEIILKYCLLWFGFTIFSSNYDFHKIYKYTYYALILLTFFGVVNLFIHSAPWISWFGNENYDPIVGMESERFHVNSLFSNSFNYGFISLISLVFFYVGYTRKYVDRSLWYKAVVMCVFGIIIHGSRTVLAISSIFVLGVLLSLPSLGKKIYVSGGLLIVFFLSYILVPEIHVRVNLLFGTFDPNNTISGSSFEMRDMQYNAVLSYIMGNPVFGRGYRFFYYDLGWGEFYSGGRVDSDLRGLEGVHLNYLLERGIFGYVSYLFFYFSLLWVIIKSKGEIVVRVMAVSTVLIYLSFSHMTGELGTAPIALFFTGFFYRMSLNN